MQTLDFVSGLYNCREFSQPSRVHIRLCKHGQKTFFFYCLSLEFNKSYKQDVSKIKLFKKLNFQVQSQNNCWRTDLCQEWNIKTSL